MNHGAMTLVLSLINAYGYLETVEVLPSMITGVLSSLTEEWQHSGPGFRVPSLTPLLCSELNVCLGNTSMWALRG